MKQADVLRVLVEQLPRRGRRDSPVKHGRRWVLKFLFLFPVRHVEVLTLSGTTHSLIWSVE